MTNNNAIRFAFLSCLSLDSDGNPSECYIPRSYHEVLEAMKMVRFGGANEGKIFIQPRETKYKSLPHHIKGKVNFLQQICEAGFAYGGYVLIHTTNEGVCKVEFFQDMAKVKGHYDAWVVEPDSDILIFLDTKRTAHGDSWDATVEVHAALAG